MTADYPGLYVPDHSTARHLIRSHTWLVRDDDTGELSMVDVDDMTPSHRAHLLDWLRRNAWLMRAHVDRSIREALKWRQITWAEHDAELAALRARPAEVWLEDTPLVRRLVQLAPPVEPPPPRPRRLPARLTRRTR